MCDSSANSDINRQLANRRARKYMILEVVVLTGVLYPFHESGQTRIVCVFHAGEVAEISLDSGYVLL